MVSPKDRDTADHTRELEPRLSGLNLVHVFRVKGEPKELAYHCKEDIQVQLLDPQLHARGFV